MTATTTNNNNNTYPHPSQQHQLGDDHRRNGSGAPASVGALEISKEARINVLKEEVMQALRLLNVFANVSPSTHLSEDDAAAAREESNMQILRIPTQSVNHKPGPTLNPASCASGLALLGGDWTSAPSLEGMNGGQGVTHRQNASRQNEDWGDFHLPEGNQFL
jgi:hypothetical protein